MIPGEIVFGEGDVEINPGAARLELEIVNTGDRPVQVGSHVHVPQANSALHFDRGAAHGHRFDIPAGTAIRFEPGVAQRVSLVPLAGAREVHGLSMDPPGKLDDTGGAPARRPDDTGGTPARQPDDTGGAPARQPDDTGGAPARRPDNTV